MLGRVLLVVLAACLLAGCKAENVQLRVSASAIEDALGGAAVDVPFIVTYRTFSNLDDEQRAQLKSLEAIARNYLDVEAFDVTSDDNTVNITIEGTLPLVTRANEAKAAKSPWQLVVTQSQFGLAGFPLKVELVSTPYFDAMENDMEEVNYMSSADEFNPTQIRIRADSDHSLRVLAGGIQVEGENYGLRIVDIADGGSATLNFSGGAYDSAGAVFLLGGLPQ